MPVGRPAKCSFSLKRDRRGGGVGRVRGGGAEVGARGRAESRHDGRVTNTEPAEVVASEVRAAARLKGLAVVSVCCAVVALAIVFVPYGVVPAGLVAVAGLVVGIVCLIRDPGFNLLALGGTVLSSAAASTVAVVVILRAIG